MSANLTEPVYGSKAQNLIDIATTLHGIPGVEIPTIHPLSHQSVLKLFLLCGLNIQEEWDRIVQTLPTNTSADAIVDQATTGALAVLQEQIKAVSQTQEFGDALKASEYNGESLSAFLTSNIMCRSSSDEDKADFANPGGNESFPATTDLVDVASKVGAVVASYFSAKSLAQRREANEGLQYMPLCSVLLQHMVGEAPQDPKQATEAKPDCISGVTFTSAADGLTRGLMVINCTYGHGEGVVQGTVPSDTYLLNSKRELDQIIVDKGRRIAPLAGAIQKLAMILNPRAAWNKKACLTPKQTQKLANLCQRLELAAGKPLDIEWVFKGGKFYIVQSRELSKPKQTAEPPKYIAEVESEKLINKSTPLVTATNVREITSPQQVIITKNLAQALRYFLTHKPKDVKAIFVEGGVITSHEANFFRWAGIPVYISKDLAEIQSKVNSHQTLVLCCQTGNLYSGKSTDFSIKDGMYMHSYLQEAQSLTSMPSVQKELDLAIANPKSKDKSRPRGSKTANNPFAEIKKLLHQLRLTDDETLISKLMENITEIHFTLTRNIYSKKDGAYLDLALKQELDIVLQNAFSAARQLSTIITDHDSSDPVEYQQQKLLAINRLQNLVFQDAYAQTQNAYSLHSIAEDIASIVKYKPYLTNLDTADRLAQVLKISSLCLNPIEADNLRKYLQILAKDHPLEFAQTCDMLAHYQRNLLEPEANNGLSTDNGLLPLVVNLMPDLSNLSGKKALGIFKEEWRRYKKISDSTLIPTIKGANDLNNEWQLKVSQWANQENFAVLAHDFQQFIQNFKTRIEMLQLAIKENDTISQQLLINSLRSSLDIYDLSLKTLSIATNYSSVEQQCQAFIQMLDPYYELSTSLIQVLPADIQRKFMLHERYVNSAKQSGTATRLVRRIFDKIQHGKVNPYLLHPSAEFDVSIAKFTNNANPLQVLAKMQTLADVFTLAHQNSLDAIGLIQSNCFDIMSKLPANVSRVIQECIMGQTRPNDAKPQLVNWTIDGTKVCLNFNLSLREHSANFKVNFDIIDPKTVSLELTLIMDNELDRCINTRVASRKYAMQQQKNGISLQGFNPVETLTSHKGNFSTNAFVWHIDTESAHTDAVQGLTQHIKDLFFITYAATSDNFDDRHFYSPGMFKDSFSGVYECLEIALTKNDPELMYNITREILSAMVDKVVLNQQAEILILQNLRKLAPTLKSLFDNPNAEFRAKTLKLFTDLLDKPELFNVLVQGCENENGGNFYFFNYLHELLLGLPSVPEAKLLADKIQARFATFELLNIQTPTSIRRLLTNKIPLEDLSTQLQDAYKKFLALEDIDEFIKHADIYTDICKTANSNLIGSLVNNTLYIDWLAIHPEHFASITNHLYNKYVKYLDPAVWITPPDGFDPEHSKLYLKLWMQLSINSLSENTRLEQMHYLINKLESALVAIKNIDDAIGLLKDFIQDPLNFEVLFSAKDIKEGKKCYFIELLADSLAKLPQGILYYDKIFETVQQKGPLNPQTPKSITHIYANMIDKEAAVSIITAEHSKLMNINDPAEFIAQAAVFQEFCVCCNAQGIKTVQNGAIFLEWLSKNLEHYNALIEYFVSEFANNKNYFDFKKALSVPDHEFSTDQRLLYCMIGMAVSFRVLLSQKYSTEDLFAIKSYLKESEISHELKRFQEFLDENMTDLIAKDTNAICNFCTASALTPTAKVLQADLHIYLKMQNLFATSTSVAIKRMAITLLSDEYLNSIFQKEAQRLLLLTEPHDFLAGIHSYAELLEIGSFKSSLEGHSATSILLDRMRTHQQENDQLLNFALDNPQLLSNTRNLSAEQAQQYLAVCQKIAAGFKNNTSPEQFIDSSANLVLILKHSIPDLCANRDLAKQLVLLLVRDCAVNEPAINLIKKYPKVFDPKFQNEIAKLIRVNQGKKELTDRIMAKVDPKYSARETSRNVRKWLAAEYFHRKTGNFFRKIKSRPGN